jgi:hypothetical protein
MRGERARTDAVGMGAILQRSANGDQRSPLIGLLIAVDGIGVT